MYCVNCGVKLAESEQKCPLCGVKAYHPELPKQQGRPLYPRNVQPATAVRKYVGQVATLLLFLLPFLLTMIIDLRFHSRITWSGFVMSGLVLCYVVLALPGWFQKPNWTIFVPCDFAAVALYLWYIEFSTGGHWFWSFALPVSAGLCLIVTTLVTLCTYLRRGRLYVFGGAYLALSAWMLLVELTLDHTFDLSFAGWSLYPLVVLALLGVFLIFLAINKSARERVERKLFL